MESPTAEVTAAAEQMGPVLKHILLPTRLACHLILQQGIMHFGACMCQGV